MKSLEDIFLTIILILILSFIILFALWCLWCIIKNPYCNYKLYRRDNKIQWRCVETFDSMNDRMAKGRSDFECYLEYRILPSELNKFVRIYGDNTWNPGFTGKFTFVNKEQFKTFVSNFQTYGQVKDYIQQKNGVLWVEPEN